MMVYEITESLHLHSLTHTLKNLLDSGYTTSTIPDPWSITQKMKKILTVKG